jgi:hypothetical protein
VAVGEFDGDGSLDVVVANSESANVSILLGHGDGTFQDARNFAVGRDPKSVAVGDFNGDGLPDIVVANFHSLSSNVSVLLGRGDGTFTHTSYLAGQSPDSVAVGDFDGDGWPDLAVTNFSSNDVSLLLNAADDAAFFYVYAPESVPAGQPFDLTVYALSGTGLLAHGYRGTVAFWSSDEAATLPEPYRFRPEDGGIAPFPAGVTLRTPGLQELYAFDLETFTVFGFAFVEVLGPFGGGAPGPVPDLFIAEVVAGRSEPARR